MVQIFGIVRDIDYWVSCSIEPCLYPRRFELSGIPFQPDRACLSRVKPFVVVTGLPALDSHGE